MQQSRMIPARGPPTDFDQGGLSNYLGLCTSAGTEGLGNYLGCGLEPTFL